MKIYWFKAQAPQRVLALVKYLGIKADLIEIDLMGGGLKTPAYVAINPNMKAPTLVDGDLVLWESSAIMAHLCIKASSDMWPAHPLEQVDVLRWLSWNDSHWGPAVSAGYFEHIVKSGFKMGPPNLESIKSSLHNVAKYGKVLDAHLNGKKYVSCNRLTIADFQLASMAMYWRECELPLGDFTNIVRWLDGLMKIPAWANPWPPK